MGAWKHSKHCVAFWVALGLSSCIALSSSGAIITAEPACAKRNTSVKITCSGYAASPIPCLAVVFLYFIGDGGITQIDSWPINFNVDAHVTNHMISNNESAGTKTYRLLVKYYLPPHYVVQLTLICVETDIEVVHQLPNDDPWTYSPLSDSVTIPISVPPYTNTYSRVGFRFHFDPALVCSMRPCNTIGLIQMARLRYLEANNDTISYDYSSMSVFILNYMKKYSICAGMPGNTAIDGHDGAEDLWLNGRDNKDSGPFGRHTFLPNDPSAEAWTDDLPGYPPRDFEIFRMMFPSLKKMIWDFEMYAVCISGSGEGQYLGRLTWRWTLDDNPLGQPQANILTESLGGATGGSVDFNKALDCAEKEGLRSFPRLRGIPHFGGRACVP